MEKIIKKINRFDGFASGFHSKLVFSIAYPISKDLFLIVDFAWYFGTDM